MSDITNADELVCLEIDANDERICLITLNRPKRRNSFNNEMADAFSNAVERFENDPTLKVAILAGAGPVFCSGMDLAAFAAGERPGLESEYGFAHFVKRPRTKPIIAAVQGGAYAGGFEIMLACDLVVSTDDAKFSVPEVKRGIIAAGGGAVRLPSRLPRAVANEMLFTGDPITAQRAFEFGLVNRVVPADQLIDAALKLAANIAVNAPMAVMASKAISDYIASNLEGEAWYRSSVEWKKVERSKDALEGATAFTERREPVWRGE